VVFKSGKNLESILTAKNKEIFSKYSYAGVYRIPCTCGKEPYVGETKKKIITRMREHESYIEKGQLEKSGIALHTKECNGQIKFEDTQVVTKESRKFERKIRETLEIQKNNSHTRYGGMNQDKGQYVTTRFWIPLMKYLRNAEEK